MKLNKANSLINSTNSHKTKEKLFPLIMKLVNQLNHSQSTSLSRSNYRMILKTIEYMIDHDYSSTKTDIESSFQRGYEQVQIQAQQIQNILSHLQLQRLPYNNIQYRSILNHQIDAFLARCKKGDGLFHYYHTDEDLDYPLLDGIPLDHAMYHLDGTDLVLTYLQRFQLEHEFCVYFYQDISLLIQQFENQRGISVEGLQLSLCEVILIQWLANQLLHHNSIFLTRKDVQVLHHYQGNDEQLKRELRVCFNNLKHYFSSELVNHLTQHFSLIYVRFNQSIQDETDLFICCDDQAEEKIILQNTMASEKDFLEHLQHLEGLDDVELKIHYLQKTSFSITDLVDMLQHQIFVEDELFYFFDTLQTVELASFLLVLNPELCVFHQIRKLDETLWEEIDRQNEWQESFIDYLKRCSAKKKEAIATVLNQLSLLN